MPKTSPTMMIVAWGQYIHWAHLQFERFMSDEEGGSDGPQVGVIAHWLASEYVVLEGWRELGFTDNRVSKLIQLYPDNCETLRLCRNAVYHFQSEILDRRIVACLQDQNEELLWSIALHYEFQRFLVTYPYMLTGTIEEKMELADEMALCVGWAPQQNPSAARIRILRKCIEFERALAANDSPNKEEGRKLVVATLKGLAGIEDAPYCSKLTRWPAA